MKRCKDCFNFNNKNGWSNSETDGQCDRLSRNTELISDAHFNCFIAFGRDLNPDFVHVGANFGCVHFVAISDSDEKSD